MRLALAAMMVLTAAGEADAKIKIFSLRTDARMKRSERSPQLVQRGRNNTAIQCRPGDACYQGGGSYRVNANGSISGTVPLTAAPAPAAPSARHLAVKAPERPSKAPQQDTLSAALEAEAEALAAYQAASRRRRDIAAISLIEQTQKLASMAAAREIKALVEAAKTAEAAAAAEIEATRSEQRIAEQEAVKRQIEQIIESDKGQ